MNKLAELVNKNSELLHEFSSRCIGRIEGHGPFKVLLAPFHRFLAANVEKEVTKDRLIIECAVAAYYDETEITAEIREELFEKTRQVDDAFLKNVPLYLLPDIRHQDFADIRKERIGVLLETVCDLMKNWKEHRSFPETVRKTYSPEQFSRIIIDILDLYSREAKMVAASAKLPPLETIAKVRMETKLYTVMESVAEEIAGEITEEIFAFEWSGQTR